MKLTKSQIIKNVLESIGFSPKQATAVVETVIEILKRTLESGEDVLISGFGRFKVL